MLGVLQLRQQQLQVQAYTQIRVSQQEWQALSLLVRARLGNHGNESKISHAPPQHIQEGAQGAQQVTQELPALWDTYQHQEEDVQLGALALPDWQEVLVPALACRHDATFR